MAKTEKIISFGLYLLVFLLPWQTRWIIRAGEINGGYWEYGTISLYGTDVLLFLLLVLFSYFVLQNHKTQIIPPQRDPARAVAKPQNTNYPATAGPRQGGGKTQTKLIYFFIIGLNLISLISIFFAADKLVAAQAYVRLTLGMGLFFLVSNAGYDRIKLLYAFLSGAAFQATLGIWQFLTQSTFANKWLGLAAHPAAAGGSSVIETLAGLPAGQAGGRWLRAYGGLDHPNVLGGLLAVAILILLSLRGANATTQSKVKINVVGDFYWRSPRSLRSLAMTIIFYFLFFIFLSALFFTFSRGAWAGLIVGLVVYFGFWILDFRFGNAEARSGVGEALKIFLKLIAASAVFISILFFSYKDLVLTRLSQDTRLEIKSSAERMASYRDAAATIKGNLLAGVGIGNYTLALKNFYPGRPAWFYQPAHNVFLLVWAELGIIGLILFVVIFVYLIFFNLKLNKLKLIQNSKLKIKNSNDDTDVNDGYFNSTLLLVLFIIMLVDHYFWSLHFGVLFFWLLIGLAAKELREERADI